MQSATEGAPQKDGKYAVVGAEEEVRWEEVNSILKCRSFLMSQRGSHCPATFIPLVCARTADGSGTSLLFFESHSISKHNEAKVPHVGLKFQIPRCSVWNLTHNNVMISLALIGNYTLIGEVPVNNRAITVKVQCRGLDFTRCVEESNFCIYCQYAAVSF